MAAFHAELVKVLPEGQERLTLFRPPYGQRGDAVLKQLASSGLTDVLWNIDSQDWQAAVTPRLAAGRVVTLMLLWRRGILLFHDIHPKAREALPLVWSQVDTGVTWLACRDFARQQMPQR
jgi:peptidoglycan/xylan/chitin deacetylase (PgdA/CDA1 family)